MGYSFSSCVTMNSVGLGDCVFISSIEMVGSSEAGFSDATKTFGISIVPMATDVHSCAYRHHSCLHHSTVC